MSKNLSTYCKAYLGSDLKAYSGWQALSSSAAVADEDILYVHDSFRVTTGIFGDEGVVVDRIDNEWVRFCTSTLEFRVPDDVRGAEAV
jgi:hypothetical protein